MSHAPHIVCPHCDSVNRVPADKLGAADDCGSCHRPLFPGKPIALTAERFEKHLTRGDIPLLVDFWASWCAPCRVMAPVFERAAADLEPRIRLVKVDTDEEQALAGRYAIRGIPTLILFKGGQEAGRVSGAMDHGSLLAWVQQHL